MPQVSDETRRKFVFICTGPEVPKEGLRWDQAIDAMRGLAVKVCGWKVEFEATVPLSAQVEIKQAEEEKT